VRKRRPGDAGELASRSVQYEMRPGTVGVFSTMSPTAPPAVHHLAFRKLSSEDDRMGAPTGAAAGSPVRPRLAAFEQGNAETEPARSGAPVVAGPLLI
jgi:hypothetical protein